MVDVIAPREAERALDGSDARFREIAEKLHEVFWVTDPAKTRMLYVSPAYEEIWGRSCASLYERPLSFAEAIHPEDRPRVLAGMASQASGDYDEIYRIERPDGTLRWIHDHAFPIHGPGGELLRVVGSAQDITELKQTEQALRESEGRYRSMMANLSLASVMLDVEARVTYCNDYFLELTGWAREDVVGQDWFKLFLPPDDTDLRHFFSDLLADLPEARRHENEILTRDGGRRMIRWSNSVLRSTAGRVVGTAAIGEDVTGLKRTEDQLRQSQKMEAIGRLAGGVAHDFNNSLGVILGYTELLIRHAAEPERGKLEQILKATQHASGLTRQLLAFSRKQVVDPKVLDLNVLVSDLQQMLGRLIGEDVDLAIVPEEDLGLVKADPGQLEQVVINLCLNARDAMPHGGLLRIETANADLDAGHSARHERMPPGRYVMVSVSDTGSGMDEDVMSKIFEPFFTTKEQGKGTGLGLAMVYGIVKQAGGYVWMYSEVGRGTTAKLFLPRIDAPATAPDEHEAPLPARGSETILLVEDEGALRAIAREILEEHGYRVIDAGSAREALDIARGHEGPIHLLVTDVVMPGVNGRALAEALKAARPGMAVLYMSGYTDDVLAHRGVLASGTLLLEKPFNALALLGSVHDALGDRGRAPGVPEAPASS